MTAPTVPEMKALGSSPDGDTHRAAEEAVLVPEIEVEQDEDCVDVHFSLPGAHGLLSAYVRKDSVTICGAGAWERKPVRLAHDAFSDARQQAAVSTASQVGIGPLADEPKIVPAPTEKGDGVVLAEGVGKIIDPWAFNQCEWASHEDNDEVLRTYIPRRDEALAKAGRIIAMISATQQATGEGRDVVAIPREVVDFLVGSGPLEGLWFGEAKPITGQRRGEFWWRQHLLQALATQQAVSPPEGVVVPGPGGWLVKDFADGWYWTGDRLNADMAANGGACVYRIDSGEYETEAAGPHRNAADGGSSNEGGSQ